MKTRILCFALASLSLSLLSDSARSDVLVVDPVQPSAFATPQEAIDAASDGDTVLLRPASTYPGFTIDGKGVEVIHEGTVSSVMIQGTIVIANQVAGQRVRLAGLSVRGQDHAMADSDPRAQLAPGPGLIATNVAGALRFQDCSFWGGAGFQVPYPTNLRNLILSPSGYDGALMTGCPNVAFVRCQLKGGKGQSHIYGSVGGRGGRGVDSLDSAIAFYDCTLQGGQGGWGCGGGSGGAAYVIDGWGGFLSGCTVQGGNGGQGFDILPNQVGGGGIDCENGQIQWIDSTVAGGTGGWTFAAGTSPSGLDWSGEGARIPFVGEAVGLNGPRTVRENQTMTMTVTGQPGERAVLIRSVNTRFRPWAAVRGVALVGHASGWRKQEARYLIVGTIPASGVLTVNLPIGELSPGVQSKALRFQAMTYVPGQPSSGTLGDFSEVTILDSAF